MKLPSYSLTTIKENIRKGNFRITQSAISDSSRLGLDEDDIEEIAMNLLDSDFYKTMESERMPERMQDVYKPVYSGISLYFKVQLTNQTIIISCKQNTGSR